jgi:hypothetical protein
VGNPGARSIDCVSDDGDGLPVFRALSVTALLAATFIAACGWLRTHDWRPDMPLQADRLARSFFLITVAALAVAFIAACWGYAVTADYHVELIRKEAASAQDRESLPPSPSPGRWWFGMSWAWRRFP